MIEWEKWSCNRPSMEGSVQIVGATSWEDYLHQPNNLFAISGVTSKDSRHLAWLQKKRFIVIIGFIASSIKELSHTSLLHIFLLFLDKRLGHRKVMIGRLCTHTLSSLSLSLSILLLILSPFVSLASEMHWCTIYVLNLRGALAKLSLKGLLKLQDFIVCVLNYVQKKKREENGVKHYWGCCSYLGHSRAYFSRSLITRPCFYTGDKCHLGLHQKTDGDWLVITRKT